ncbi:hypothetical protein [Streptosporangium sp. NPDC000396]|uniref:hypothetical protein n=1 Tax=Streptosporangium sp. NPDC000396 TaxID=3366185 RepID=UPI0036D12450
MVLSPYPERVGGSPEALARKARLGRRGREMLAGGQRLNDYLDLLDSSWMSSSRATCDQPVAGRSVTAATR